MKKIFLLLFICCNFSITLVSQNVGINNTGAAPVASAMLDIVATDKGLLVPRFALSDVTVAAPVVAPAISLIVYNTATAGVTPNNVIPGFYYWDGSKWVAFSGSGGREWALLGNAGTVAGTNFLGTTDNVDLQFRVNNIQGGKINIASDQTYFGYQSGLATTGIGNSFFGSSSGIANIGGTHNTAVGYLTFTTSTTGNFNTTVGYGSMRNNLSGSNNTFIGTNAGANWSATSNNTGVGMFALQGLSAGTGVGNSALGYAAGSGTTPNNLATGTGSYNTFLGYNTAINNSAFTNATAIGANALAGASNVMILGGVNGTNGATATTSVGIGLTVPTTLLDAFSGAGDAVFGHSSNVGGYLGRETNITFGTPVQTVLGAGLYAANPTAGYTSSYAQSTGLATVAANINFSSVWMASYNYVENASAANNPKTIYAQLNNSIAASSAQLRSAIQAYSQNTAAGNPAFTIGSIDLAIGNNQDSYGVYGYAQSNSTTRAGGYFECYNNTPTQQAYAYVGTSFGGVNRKITGTNAVSEIVPTANHGRITLTAPESPEYWYQDYGTVELVNGKAHVDLDPILADIIVVNNENPIRVFCTPVDMLDYNGVAILNKTATGFDVIEVNGGTHSGKIDYQLIAKPKTGYGEGRFHQAPGPAWLKPDLEPASAKAKNQTIGREIFYWPADWEVYGYDVEKTLPIGAICPTGSNRGKFKVAEGVFMDHIPAQQPKK